MSSDKFSDEITTITLLLYVYIVHIIVSTRLNEMSSNVETKWGKLLNMNAYILGLPSIV